MKVVGLLSGGKDSCYNLIHCVQQGHEIVALATLSPPGSKDELDSYMYQTVGHDAVHLVAQAMDLPLYRRIIKGTAINQKSEYGSRAPSCWKTPAQESLDDETEDLYHLLMEVKLHHPEIQAVSVGAILSNYQRVRVEHVSLRPELNLTPLTFLWQRSQSELYAEMLDTGLVSIIIKVAGIGLDQRDLGKTLGQMQIKLEKLNSMYGAHVCGEGGEYETLTINSPLFKKRLDVGETETVVHSDSAFGSVSYLRLKNARLVEKATEGKHAAKARTPPLLDKVGRRTLRAASNAIAIIENKRSSASFKHGLDCFKIRDHQPLPQPSIRRKGRYLVLSNIIGTPFTSTQDQVKSAFTTISSLLSTIPPSNSLDLSHISHINLYLSSQTLFPLINSVYRTMFGVSPPTRACVALPCLPQGVDLVINAIAFDDTLFSSNSTASQFDRRALHVQARSFWAPANIGPYSQSLVVAEKVWIAGQIGLVPADLTLPEGGRRETEQAALSVQHARRIFKATLGDMGGRSVDKGWVEGGLCWIEQGAGRIEVATRVWMAQAVELSHQEECQDDENQETREGEEQDEYWLGQTHLSGQGLPPMLFVTLPKGALPRSAVIEWQITAHTGRFPSSLLRDEHVPNKVGKHNEEEDDDDDDDDDEQEFIGSDVDDVIIHRTQAVLTSSNGTTFLVVHTITRSQDAKSQFGILCLSRLKRTQVEQESAEQTLTTSLRELVDRAYATQLFQPLEPHGAQDEALHLLETVLSQNDTEPKLLDKAQRIPCSCLHILSPDSTTQPVELAFVWHGI